jgi:hypothetical protein
MSNSNNSGPLFGSSSRSGFPHGRSTYEFAVLAIACAVFVLCGGAARASTNVLTNPGAESGDLSGWNVSLTGYLYAVSTNSLINGPGSGYVLSHSGQYVFQLFDTTADSAILYQDFPAGPGSQWSASCDAICYASNYFNPGATAHLQIGFYDVSNNVIADPGFAAPGVYGSNIMDPAGSPDPINLYWIFAPPMAVDANGWVYLNPTNYYYSDPAMEASWAGATTEVHTAPPGTALVRFQIEFDNTITDGGAVYWDDCALTKLVGTDPDITSNPTAVTVYAGLPAFFTVEAVRAQKGERLTYQWQKDGTNLPPAGGVYNINGATTNQTLAFSNCQAFSAGMYAVMVTDITTNTPPVTNSIRSVPVALTVLTLSPLQKANVLGANAGFENNPTWLPWNIFNGCYFVTSNAFYGTSTTPVNILDGDSAALTGMNGDRDNGFWQSVAAAPGTVWKAGAWAYISSLNEFDGGNTCRLQIWFKDAAGNSLANLPTYESFKIYGLSYTNSDQQYTNIDVSSPQYGQVGYHAMLPRDQWVLLQATNAVNNNHVGLQDDLPTNTLPSGDFVMPASAAQINFQVYEFCPVASDNLPYPGLATDAVYWDNTFLIQVLPVTDLTASAGGGNINLHFSAGAGLAYKVLYKTNLTEATWKVLTSNITAPDSWATNPASTDVTYPITVSYPVSGSSRFYRVEAY